MNMLKFSFIWRCASVATVSKTIDDLPEPETPVKIVILRLGMRSEMFLRLFSRAPRISMYSWLIHAFGRAPLGVFLFDFVRLKSMAARTRFFRARSLILSPSNKSIARQVLPPKPALKSLSGSGRLAPWEKVSFTLSLCALPTAIIPSRDHTGLPIHFHSSMISRSAPRMLLRMVAKVLPRQSVSPAISWSIRCDGFIGFLCLQLLSHFYASSFAAVSCLADLFDISCRRTG